MLTMNLLVCTFVHVTTNSKKMSFEYFLCVFVGHAVLHATRITSHAVASVPTTSGWLRPSDNIASYFIFSPHMKGGSMYVSMTCIILAISILNSNDDEKHAK